MSLAPVHIVWFKKDLRIDDHAPLAEACKAGPVIAIYCWEPTTVEASDYAMQHQQFTIECLASLRRQLQKIGLDLIEYTHGIIDALNQIRKTYPIARLYSHEECGNNATFQIDIAVKKWCQHHNVDWQEHSQNGVVRRLKNRDEWHKIWEARMGESIVAAPKSLIAAVDIKTLSPIPTAIPLASGIDKPRRQRGGRELGLTILNSFMENRASHYRGGISSPLNAINACSRISPYLAFGCLSMREVVQYTRIQRSKLKEVDLPQSTFHQKLKAGLTAFESRLHWHCHFMQKLESEPQLEYNNMHQAFDGIREKHLPEIEAQKRLRAWTKGETGWPLIDACMAMLRETGWVNFRMRAMLMSTASYLYWLHWREPGLHLAREFLDYEPGIHWPQVQMQSGTTGMNAIRIYNPIKQAMDQDPQGAFVRRWIPALRHVPDNWIFEPYLMPKNLQLQYGCVIEKDYPMPILDIKHASREAKQLITLARKQAGAYEVSRAIVKKHGSRKNMRTHQRRSEPKSAREDAEKNTKQTPVQQTLF